MHVADPATIAGETLLALADVARRYRECRTGGRLHYNRVHRWARNGVCGVKLGVVHVRGKPMTSAEELDRWWRAVASARPLPAGRKGNPPSLFELRRHFEAIASLASVTRLEPYKVLGRPRGSRKSRPAAAAA